MTIRASYRELALWAIAGCLVGLAMTFPARQAQAVACPGDNWHGSAMSDTLHDTTDGLDENNQWYGEGGGDFLYSEMCSETPFGVFGRDGDDYIKLGVGDDYGNGNNNHDTVIGEGGNDTLIGFVGRDLLTDTNPNDTDIAQGDADNDTINVSDGDNNDQAQGGAGTDTCTADSAVEKTNCEM